MLPASSEGMNLVQADAGVTGRRAGAGGIGRPHRTNKNKLMILHVATVQKTVM